MVLVAVISTALIFLIIQWELQKRERTIRKQRAIAVVEQLGGQWWCEPPSQRLAIRHFLGPEYYARIEGVDLARCAMNGHGLDFLQDLTGLATVNLSYSDISDDDLIVVNRLRYLEYLDIRGTGVTAAGLQVIEQMRTMKRIRCSSSLRGSEAVSRLERTNVVVEVD